MMMDGIGAETLQPWPVAHRPPAPNPAGVATPILGRGSSVLKKKK